jgi:hypothetical protein
MYEHKTFEVLLSEMLAYVKGKCPDLDTRTGSIIYNALASVAMELETAYHEMDMIMDETFLETASKEYLCKHGTLLGVELKEATSAHFVGEFNVMLVSVADSTLINSTLPPLKSSLIRLTTTLITVTSWCVKNRVVKLTPAAVR